MENPSKVQIEASMNKTLSMDHCIILFVKPKKVIFVPVRSSFTQTQIVLVAVSTAILTALVILTVVLLRRRCIKAKEYKIQTIRPHMLMVESNEM